MRLRCLDCRHSWSVRVTVWDPPDEWMWCPKAKVPVVIAEDKRRPKPTSKAKARREFRRGATIRVRHKRE
jgi:hypothetical protein